MPVTYGPNVMAMIDNGGLGGASDMIRYKGGGAEGRSEGRRHRQDQVLPPAHHDDDEDDDLSVPPPPPKRSEAPRRAAAAKAKYIEILSSDEDKGGKDGSDFEDWD